MASKDGGQAFAPVLAAVATMQGNVPRSEKAQAHEFLEKFQKSVCEGRSIVEVVLFRVQLY
jgi:transportin-3